MAGACFSVILSAETRLHRPPSLESTRAMLHLPSRWSCVLLLIAACTPALARADQPVSFRNEVMAVLSRAGCNQGTCHGNLNGKGGFKLSLRGQDPDRDLLALTREQQGRRANRLDPDRSLLLQKATGQVPHEGGVRFSAQSPEYALLRQWIADGQVNDFASARKVAKLVVTPTERFLIQPTNEIKIQATAVYADGKRIDVSHLAVFESTNPKMEAQRDGTVRSEQPGETTIVVRYLEQQATTMLAFIPQRPGFAWSKPAPFNFIDGLVHARLEKLRVNPSAVSGDTEFLRRAHIDLIGLLPSPDETRRFLADSRPDKRAQLIDALLERPEFVDWWTLKWSDVLRNEEKLLDRQGVKAFQGWIKKLIASNQPLNEFARDLIVSRGSTYKEPASNYYRALRDPQARAEATAQVFLGVRMQCAKCHNHPFNQITQADYHQLAAFFPRIGYKIVENKRRDKLDSHEFDGEQIVQIEKVGEVKHPVSGEVLKPKLLGGPTLNLADGDDRLQPLADWVASPDNPYFARTQANRVWSHLLGRGIVDPNDDFRESNPPVNGPLLESLAKHLAEKKFDLKSLIRTIMNSRTYQLSSIPNDTNSDDLTNFSHAPVRSMPAEALLDAIAQVTGAPNTYEGYAFGTRAGQLAALPQLRSRDSQALGTKFLRQFGKPERLLSCDCERSDNTTLGQALQLITGPIVNQALSRPTNRLGKLLDAKRKPGEILDELFLAALCRLPSDSERASLMPRIDNATDRRAIFEDVLWGLLNAKEFMLVR